MIEKIVNFTGYISGDYECFCFAVPMKDFKKYAYEYDLDKDFIKYKKNHFHKNMYSLYPNNILPELDKEKKYKFEIVIKAEEV